MPSEAIQADLRALLPDHAQRHVAEAFAGDADAAARLMVDAPNNVRPDVVLYLYAALVPLPAFRAALRGAWDHDHHYLQKRLSPKLLRDMLTHGGTRPTALPSKLTVWRGGRGSLKDLRRGWSWTTDRRVACWFATVWGVNQARGGPPLVIRGTVASSRIVHADDEGGEAEMVIFGIRNAVTDQPQNWENEGRGLEEEWTAENAQALKG